MNIFDLLPISISYFDIGDIEKNQLKEEYTRFITNIKSMNYENLESENFTAKIPLDVFSIGFKVDEDISTFLKYENYILQKKEMDPYNPLNKICVDTGKEKLNLMLELVSLKPYKVKISGDSYKKYDKKWEVKKFNQVIVL
ncbi:hypothetical protein [Clostridium sp. Marseille-Q2269]|uniref:hypothetical protein n=1 Tax=Clostridium sp. Marseille-Q2269 TaxID=2942205 RepID=UPI0020738520|nr:hypothetical protein [Clostridium sp. Marseille-Q2269]